MRLWLSVHLHFEGFVYGPDGDRVLVEIVKPTVQDVQGRCDIDCYFFIRYSDGGPHIRLRLATRSRGGRECVRKELTLTLQRRCRGTEVELKWQAYEPEWDRYGGPRGMAISERFFEVSSHFALAAAHEEAFRNQRNVRRASALMGAIVLSEVFAEGDRSEAVRRLHVYGRATDSLISSSAESLEERIARCASVEANAVRPFVQESWRRLLAGEPLTPALDEFRHGVEGTRQALMRAPPMDSAASRPTTLIRHVQGSYLHMMNNRLGVLPSEEKYIAELATQALKDDERGQ